MPDQTSPMASSPKTSLPFLLVGGAASLAIAVLDRPVLGIAAALVCAFAAVLNTALRRENRSPDVTDDDAVESLIRSNEDSSFNPRNPAFPIYYPPVDRE